MEENEEVQNSNQQQTNPQQPNQQSFEETLATYQDQWVKDIEYMNEQMRDLPKLVDLMTYVHTKRQKAVELRTVMTSRILLPRTKQYTASYAQMYNNIKSGANGLRYTSDNAINIQIEAQLGDQKYYIDLLKEFIDFMEETIKTIDNIIFGITSRIKSYELLNGINNKY